jgi:hypothetical protein
MIQSIATMCRAYSDLAGAETAAKYQTPIFLVASASAELIADVALCPWEAVKVRVGNIAFKLASAGLNPTAIVFRFVCA